MREEEEEVGERADGEKLWWVTQRKAFIEGVSLLLPEVSFITNIVASLFRRIDDDSCVLVSVCVFLYMFSASSESLIFW